MRHGDGYGLVAGREHGRGNAVAFAAEDEQQSPAEVRLGQSPAVSMRMGGDATNAALAQVAQGLGQAGGFHDWELEDGAHGAAHGAAQEWAAAGFADDERLGVEGGAVADERAEVFGAGEAVRRDEQARLRAARDDVLPGVGSGGTLPRASSP